MTDLELRGATDDDVPYLWRMLTFAASMERAGDADVIEHARTDAFLRKYLEAWGRPGDIGVVARLAGELVGAAWVRLPDDETQPREPELAIATEAQCRGRGVGDAMLAELLARTTGEFDALVLSVRSGNPAVRLYERHGFVEVRRVVNRVGTESVFMRRALR